jgi:hypothetical protein
MKTECTNSLRINKPWTLKHCRAIVVGIIRNV